MAWCPKCKCEYVEGVDRCADCGCELVEHLTDEPEKRFTESLPESPEEEIAAAQLAVMEGEIPPFEFDEEDVKPVVHGVYVNNDLF